MAEHCDVCRGECLLGGMENHSPQELVAAARDATREVTHPTSTPEVKEDDAGAS